MGAITPDSMNEGVVKAGGRLKFEITPRRRRDGFTLRSTLLSFPVWYQTLNEAVSYARYLGRDRGCEIRILNTKGAQIDLSEIDARHNRWMGESRITTIFRQFSAPKPAARRRIGKKSELFQFIVPETT